MAEVELKNIHKVFGRIKPVHVIRDVSLRIQDGDFVVFVGPSGCGKSTLLRMIAGLEDITQGDLFIGGQQVNDQTPSKRGIGMVFQSYALYPHMSVYENMAFGLKLAKGSKETIDQKVRQTASTLQLDGLMERKPKELSGGQRQRVAIGRAITREPKVFLFDEPLSNLDAALRVQMRMEIAKLHQRLGSTMIYVTHDQVEAMTLADKIVVLQAGKVEQFGAPLELYQQPSNQFVAGFIGSPKMNFLRGTLEQTGPNSKVRLVNGIVLEAAVDTSKASTGDSITLGVRPEHLSLQAAGNLSGEILLSEHLGNEALVHIDWYSGEESLIVRIEGAGKVQGRGNCQVDIPADQCHLFDAQGNAFPRTATLD
ncbi:MAG: sn-glycerol-3-phosphate ABC transporter ATP-binding protein UgpC [Deltaproteobacteria bacterium]|jgi:multiple sugar transport system ATP-binding protein